jgi:hypothetical protein
MAEPQAISADHPKCDDCGAPATHSYTWEWGQSGFCCAHHQTLKQQTAGNLSRGITFAVVSSTATAPLQREERVRLRAETLVAQEELSEAKERGLQLYHQNQALAAQVQSLTVQLRECEELRKDAVAAAEPLREALEKTRSQLGDAVDELGRLKVLIPLPPPIGTLPEQSGERTLAG